MNKDGVDVDRCICTIIIIYSLYYNMYTYGGGNYEILRYGREGEEKFFSGHDSLASCLCVGWVCKLLMMKVQ